MCTVLCRTKKQPTLNNSAIKVITAKKRTLFLLAADELGSLSARARSNDSPQYAKHARHTCQPSVSRRVPTGRSRLTASRFAPSSERGYVLLIEHVCVRVCPNSCDIQVFVPVLSSIMMRCDCDTTCTQAGPALHYLQPHVAAGLGKQIRTYSHVCYMHCEFPLGLTRRRAIAFLPSSLQSTQVSFLSHT